MSTLIFVRILTCFKMGVGVGGGGRYEVGVYDHPTVMVFELKLKKVVSLAQVV